MERLWFEGVVGRRLMKGYLCAVEECLSHGSIAGRRHHNPGNSYERKLLVGGLLLVLETSVVVGARHRLSGWSSSGSYSLICRPRERGKELS